jgi:hypothetical protein
MYRGPIETNKSHAKRLTYTPPGRDENTRSLYPWMFTGQKLGTGTTECDSLIEGEREGTPRKGQKYGKIDGDSLIEAKARHTDS